MTEKEYLEELKKNDALKESIESAASLNAIVLILIKNNLTTETEFNKLAEQSKENIYKYALKNMTDAQKKGLEASKGFRDLFGKGLENFI